MRIIDADKLLKEADTEGAWGYVDKIQILEAPTIRLEDLILKGEWIDEPSERIWTTTCSNCGTEKPQHEHTKYCPDCGAIMNKIEKDGEVIYEV